MVAPQFSASASSLERYWVNIIAFHSPLSTWSKWSSRVGAAGIALFQDIVSSFKAVSDVPHLHLVDCFGEPWQGCLCLHLMPCFCPGAASLPRLHYACHIKQVGPRSNLRVALQNVLAWSLVSAMALSLLILLTLAIASLDCKIAEVSALCRMPCRSGSSNAMAAARPSAVSSAGAAIAALQTCAERLLPTLDSTDSCMRSCYQNLSNMHMCMRATTKTQLANGNITYLAKHDCKLHNCPPI